MGNILYYKNKPEPTQGLWKTRPHIATVIEIRVIMKTKILYIGTTVLYKDDQTHHRGPQVKKTLFNNISLLKNKREPAVETLLVNDEDGQYNWHRTVVAPCQIGEVTYYTNDAAQNGDRSECTNVPLLSLSKYVQNQKHDNKWSHQPYIEEEH